MPLLANIALHPPVKTAAERLAAERLAAAREGLDTPLAERAIGGLAPERMLV